MATFADSELILSPSGAVYHLNLLPFQIAPTVILVGDPDRVVQVSRYFDLIEFKVQHREFITHTGQLGNKRVSVVSTGIGTDNIDIVVNELDALVNIDLQKREENNTITQLTLVRLGTSGTLQEDIEVDSLVASSHGLGIDGLMPFYQETEDQETKALLNSIEEQLPLLKTVAIPYLTRGSESLLKRLGQGFTAGITLTSPGFYAPQGRVLRYTPRYKSLLDDARAVTAGQYRITNFEMETAGIYGLAHLLGHEALSINAIIANRANKTFSTNPAKTIDFMIQTVLERLRVG